MKDFSFLPPFTPEELQTAVAQAAAQTRSCLPRFTDKFKYSHSVHNFYEPSENTEWTTGFWTGELNLMYELTGDKDFLDAAQSQVPSYLNRIEKRIDVDHHDMGFLYTPSCVAAYKLTGNEQAKKAALAAADNLISRFQPKGRFIQAWGALGAKDNYRLIIDCLLNIPLLFWAAEITGKDEYCTVAEAHLHTSIRYVLRPDNSTFHTYFFDPDTGAPLKGVTFQGYKDDSAWARGQAWGVYGSALAYRYTKSDEAMDVFKKVTTFFLDRLPESVIPYWDFYFTEGSSEPRDSSALAIALCGMLEMAEYVDDDFAHYLKDAASRLCRRLWQDCAVKDPSVSNGQLLHGTYARKSPYNPCKNRGVDECSTWGDYFYAEALIRLQKKWNPYW